MLQSKDLTNAQIYFSGGSYGVFRDLLNKQFDSVNSILEDTEQVLERRKEELNKLFKEEMERFALTNYDHPGDYAQTFNDDFESRHITVYDTLYNSLFMSTFSLFENSLLFLFKHVQIAKEEKVSLEWDWPFNTIVEKFNKELSIDFTVNSQWQELNHYKEIRNAITHRNSTIHLKAGENIEMNKTHISIQALAQYVVLFKPDNYFRIVRKEFITDFISTVTKFYEELKNPVLGQIGTPEEELSRMLKKL